MSELEKDKAHKSKGKSKQTESIVFKSKGDDNAPNKVDEAYYLSHELLGKDVFVFPTYLLQYLPVNGWRSLYKLMLIHLILLCEIKIIKD